MKQITVVFTFNTSLAYEKFLVFFKRHFPRPDKSSWSITAMSAEHEIRRVELLEEAIGEGDLERAKAVLEMNDTQLNETVRAVLAH